MSDAAIKWRLLNHCLVTDVFTEPFPSYGCLWWLSNSGFQQTCHIIINNYRQKWVLPRELLHLLLLYFLVILYIYRLLFIVTNYLVLSCHIYIERTSLWSLANVIILIVSYSMRRLQSQDRRQRVMCSEIHHTPDSHCTILTALWEQMRPQAVTVGTNSVPINYTQIVIWSLIYKGTLERLVAAHYNCD